MDKKPVETSSTPDSTSKFNLLIALLCGLLILAHFVSSFFPKSRLWGINHLAYFPLWVRLLFTIPGLLILVPLVNSRVYKLLEQILSFFQRILPKREVLTASLLAVIAMFFFWFLRTRTHFLGDGYLVIYELKSEQYIRIGLEPLDIFSHLYLYKFLKLFFTPSSESIYAGLSIFAGGVFIFILFFITKVLSQDRFERLFIFSLFLFSGATELFLGYAEHYTLVYVSILAYLFFSFRYLQGRSKLILPIFFCALSIGLHFSAAYLFPSLFFLFALKRKKGNWVLGPKKTYTFLAILVLAAVLCAYYLWSMNRFLLDIFVPLLHSRADAPGYTIFSPIHLLDMLNQNLLLTPVGLALLLCLVTVYKQKIKLRAQFLIFMIIVSLAQILYHAVADPKFGAVRDWDLFSGVSVGFTLIGVYLFITLARSEKYSAVVLIFTALLSVTPWFFVNKSTEKAIAHLSNLLDIDPQRSFSGRYVLFTYYKEHNEPEKAKETETRVLSLFPEAYLVRVAQGYMNQGSLDTAEVILKRALAINPRFPGAYNDLGRIYFEQGKLDEAISLFRGGLQQDPFNKVFYQNLGLAFIQKGNLQDGLEALEKAVKLGAKDASVYTDIGNANAQLGDMEKAIKAYKKAIKLDPTFWVAHLNLGQLYLRLNSVDEAQVEFEQVLKLKPSHLPVYYYLGVTYSYKGMKDKAVEQFELFLKLSKDETQNQTVRGLIQQLQSQKP